MSMFSISYDLKDTTKDYTPFFNVVRHLGIHTQVLSNMYIVDVDDTSEIGRKLDSNDIYSRLKPELGQFDHILVCQVSPTDISGFLSSDSVDWIKKARIRVNNK